MPPSDTGLVADKRPVRNELQEQILPREHQDDSILRGRPTNSKHKGGENPNRYLQAPLSRSSRTLSPDALSILSTDEYEQLQPSRSLTFSAPEDGQPSESPDGWRARLAAAWIRNKGLAYMLLAQVFGVLMNVTTRLLEIEGNKGEGLHPFQILFARMSITVVLASAWMYYKKTPHFPLGKPEVRWLLAARGFGGFFGTLRHKRLSDLSLTFLQHRRLRDVLLITIPPTRRLHSPYILGSRSRMLGVLDLDQGTFHPDRTNRHRHIIHRRDTHRSPNFFLLFPGQVAPR
jgi:hypothetical protein